jgi:hypothetical protein
MGNRRLYKIECLLTVGMPESEPLKVTALNLFHPTASPPFQKVGFFILRHSLLMGEGAPACQQAGGGENDLIITPTLILPHQGGGKFFRELDALQLCCGVLHFDT